MLTPDELSNALYRASVAGLTLVPEEIDDVVSYALCDGDSVKSSGATMEDALEEWWKRKRCETGDGDLFNMDCYVCGAPLGGACQYRESGEG